jgi:hypothetical protein
LILKRLGLISLTLLIFFSCFVYFAGLYNKEKLKDINRQKDLRLANFDYAQILATDTLDILRIDNNSSYVTSREHFRKNMSEPLWDEYFSSSVYSGTKKNFSLRLKNISGEITKSNSFLFKLEVSLTEKGIVRDAIILVSVRDNIVYKIENLI